MAPTFEPQPATSRVFLFLEGPSSPLFAKIADRLETMGHRCLRINLNMGDWIFWRRRGGTNFRGSMTQWPDFIGTFMARNGVTDLVLLGEERPYHAVAIQQAREHAVDVSVIEMGYLRPDWLTIERDGMSSNSHFPAEANHILQEAQPLPEPDWTRRYSQSFIAEAAYDLLYNLPNVFLWFVFPHYRRHALFHPLAEYGGWLLRLTCSRKRKRDATAVVENVVSEQTRFFLYPLQLQTDFQLRAHSPYNGQEEAIDEVLSSFSRSAPRTTQLLVKIHPLDNGLIDWQSHISRCAANLEIAARVRFLDGGDLDALLKAAAGVVTVNSTVGLHALQRGKPVKVLGTAIFDIAGLSDQGSLDRFWSDPQPPRGDVRAAFFRLLAAALQVRGNFYSKAGTDAGAKAIADRLHRRTVNMPGGFIDPPPRRRPAKRLPFA